jgi:lipid-A-disaccharide synthase
MNLRILFVTGEVSGDVIAANLARTLRVIDPRVELSGLGGGRMQKAGVEILFNSSPFGSAGISESIVTVPWMLKAFSTIRLYLRHRRPDVAVLIGNDFFNPLLAYWLKRNDVLTIAYFPPQIWVWGKAAVLIARCYDWILTSFIEEHDVYGRAGGRVIFVGHFLRDLAEEVSINGQRAARQALGAGLDRTTVGILPGSRVHEVERLGPVLLDAARQMLTSDASIQFLLPIADPCFELEIQSMIRERGLEPCVHLNHNSQITMAASDLVMLSSGTATLEAALTGIPMVILCRVSALTISVVKWLVRMRLMDSETAGLPNLISGTMIVPELRQTKVLASSLADEASAILNDRGRQSRMKEQFRPLTHRLGEKGATEKAARTILDRGWESKRCSLRKKPPTCIGSC